MKKVLQSGVVDAVSRLSNSFGYAGIDAVYQYGQLNSTKQCKVKLAQIINKSGNTVSPSASSAQAALRSGLLADQTTCPGFGICGNVQDGADPDVWPITAISVRHLYPPFPSQRPIAPVEKFQLLHYAHARPRCCQARSVITTINCWRPQQAPWLTSLAVVPCSLGQYILLPLHGDGRCAQLRAAHDYAVWILTDTFAADVAASLKWAMMPARVSQVAHPRPEPAAAPPPGDFLPRPRAPPLWPAFPA